MWLWILLAQLNLGGQVWASYEYRSNSLDSLASPHVVRVGVATGLRVFWWTVQVQVLANSEDRFHPYATSMYGVQPTWSWGRLYFGDFSPTFSPFVLNGLVVRGYGLDLFPGPLRLFAVTGRARVPELDTLSTPPTREVQGLLIGARRAFHLELLRVQDRLQDTLTGVAPQANAVAAVALNVGTGPLRLQGNLFGSLHTYDASLTPTADLPLARTLRRWGIVVNQSSHVDYGYRTEVRFRVRATTWLFQRLYLGPGYRSLGVPSLEVDREENTVGTNFSLWNHRLNGTARLTWKRNNLSGTQEATTRAFHRLVTLAVPLSPRVQVTGTWNRWDQHRGDTLGWQENQNEVLSGGITARHTWQNRAFFHRLSVSRSRLALEGSRLHDRRAVWGGGYRLQISPLVERVQFTLGIDHQVLSDTARDLRTRWSLGLGRRVGHGVRLQVSAHWTQGTEKTYPGAEATVMVPLGQWGSLQARGWMQQGSRQGEDRPRFRLSVRYMKRFR